MMPDEDSRRGYLESILVQIPGFKGYMARENRRESDQACRDHLADRLNKAKKAVGQAKRARLQSGGLMGIERFDSVSDRLERIVSRVRHADRGYSGFFDSQQIGPNELDRLHEADLALTDLAVNIEESLSKLPDAATDDSRMSQAIEAALESIDRFEETFDQRKRAMTEED